MRRIFIAVTICFQIIFAFGQQSDVVCKKVKGETSKIIDNKSIGVMDTVLFLVQGQVTTAGPDKAQQLKGVSVTLKSIGSGEIIGAVTDENGGFKVWGSNGMYTLEILYVGFDKIIVKKLKLGSGEIRLLNARLGPGTYYEMTEK